MKQLKKIITILMTIMLSVTLISCGKVTYTKEFSYLASQKEMTLKSFQKPTKDKMGVATYVVKNQKSKDVLEGYDKQLIKAGWKITDDKKPTSIKIEKGEHVAVIVSNQVKADVQLIVVSK